MGSKKKVYPRNKQKEAGSKFVAIRGQKIRKMEGKKEKEGESEMSLKLYRRKGAASYKARSNCFEYKNLE